MRLFLLCAIGASLFYILRHTVKARPKRTHAMSVDKAASVLGVSAFASENEIKAAHRRAIKDAHPDAGGKVEDAAIINLARDTLLQYRKRFE